MRYHIPVEQYFAAIDTALAFLAERPGSGSREAMVGILAAIWDPIDPVDVMSALLILDLRERENALDLVVGRLCWGRPTNHPRAEVVAAIWVKRHRKLRS